MSINVLGPDHKVCNICERDGRRNGMEMETESGENLFICIVCLQQMIEDVSDF